MSVIKKLMMTAAGGEELVAIEDLFSTYLYTGTGVSNSSTQLVSNGINLDTVNTTVGYTSLLQNRYSSGTRSYNVGKIIEDASGNYYSIIKFRNLDTGVDENIVTKFSAANQQIWSYTVQDSQNPRYADIDDIVFNSTGNIVVFWTPASVNDQLYINVIDKDTGTILSTSNNSSTSTATYNALASGGNLYWAGASVGSTVYINSDTTPGTEIQAYKVSVGSTSILNASKLMLIPQSDGEPVLLSYISDQNSGNSTNGFVFTKLASNLQSEIWSTRWSHSNGSSTQFNSRYMSPGVHYYDATDNMLYIMWTGINSISGNTTYYNYVSKFNVGTGAHVVSKQVYFTALSTANIGARSITKFGNKIICTGTGFSSGTKNIALEFDTNLNILNAVTFLFANSQDTLEIYGGTNYVYYHMGFYNKNSEIRKFSQLALTESVGGVTPSTNEITVTSASLTNTTTGYVPIYVTFATPNDLMSSSGSSLSTNSTILTYSTAIVPLVTEPGQGGMVWIKDRGTKDNFLFDTNRGPWKHLRSNTQDGEPGVNEDALSAFNLSGFTLTGDNNVNQNYATNNPQGNYASWTFRKAPRFFDVVTYTGTGSARTVNHNLGSAPGCIFIKCRSLGTTNWLVYHVGQGAGKFGYLNTQDNFFSNTSIWQNTAPTDTQFYLGTGDALNGSGQTYVAYLFAHDPLGPSGDGSDGLIACGSYTGTGAAGNQITLGWEPQWLLIKGGDYGTNWQIFDNMRGIVVGGNDAVLYANSSASEIQSGDVDINSTGFYPAAGTFNTNYNGKTYIYIAIRRGPMRQPTSGTEVFALDQGDSTTTNPQFVSNFPVDLGIWRNTGSGNNWETSSRITGQKYLRTNSTGAELGPDADIDWDFMTGFYGPVRNTSFYSWMFRRAPGFFDVVAYTGGSPNNKQIAHNLGVTPEFIVVKQRNGVSNWNTWAGTVGQNFTANGLNSTTAFYDATGPYYFGTHTDTYFSVGYTGYETNVSNTNYIAYLFATLPGVSKVGSYTGNGTSQTINCGFTGGARFVLIKRADSTGDWYVWDTARGIVSGNDPHMSLNTTAAQVTTNDTIDPASSGFIVNQVSATNVNVSSASYIYLAIA